MAAIDPSKVLRYAKRTERNRELQTFIGSIPVGTKFCQNNLMSICPRCITEWQTEGGQLVAGAPVWWQAVVVRSCHRHGISLIELPKPEDVRCNYDVAGRSGIILARSAVPMKLQSRHQRGNLSFT